MFNIVLFNYRHFLVTRDLRDVTVIGHSMGARTAMLLCLTDPERVRDGFAVDATPIHSTPAYGVRTLKEYFRCGHMDAVSN